MWGKSAKAAHERLDAGDSRTDFLNNKLISAKFYMERLMPETALRKARIETGADSVMALAADAF
jgi:acyl-CoA dehydrogenase